VQLAGDAPKLAQAPAGDEQDGDAQRPGHRNRLTDGRIETIIARNSAVVVERQRGKFHRASPWQHRSRRHLPILDRGRILGRTMPQSTIRFASIGAALCSAG
jgi:hypothetical protein